MKKARLFCAVCIMFLFAGTLVWADETVAQINGVQYETLAEAVNNAPNGAETTIELTSNIVMQTQDIVTIPADKNIRLDMKGYGITVESDFQGRPIVNYGTLTITGNGTISSAASTQTGYGAVNNYGVLTIENGTYENGEQANGATFYNRQGGTMTFKGGNVQGNAFPAIISISRLVIHNGIFENTSCNQNTLTPYYTVLSGGNAQASVTVYGGKITGTQGALGIIGGSVDIEGGTFLTRVCPIHGDVSGTIYHALYVTGEEAEVSGVVNNGIFQTEGTNAAVQVGNVGSQDGKGLEASLQIKGGTFTSKGTNALMSKTEWNSSLYVTGGSFSSDVRAYVPAGSTTKQNDQGQYVITPANDALFKIGNVGYLTLADAVAAVPADGTQTTITMLNDAQGDGAVVKEGQNIVFDFGGHTYNVNGNLVGSAGTETSGMQLLKGSVVTLKNGTLTSDKAKILVQNYCNLTLDGVKLDGTQSSSCGYVLSNNFGNTVVTGNTTITAGTGKVAFDLWYGMSDAYKDGVSITFDKNFTGTVTGKVEYGAQKPEDGWEGKTSLAIQGGTFNTQFVASSGNDMKQANISISGGSFTSGDVLDYLAPGFELKKNADGTFGVVKKSEPSGQTTASTAQKTNPKTGLAA